ncbi:hypothetical protein GCM10010198_02290 [Nocardia seriolae]|nr:hypothetical protein NSERKGN1266_22790 [Nocardia seriolae]BEK97666.1 hypothetical protein NSER024013_55720 [Nocardia seriolae]GEM22863.1 hypothetical protein NS2_11020 [Nocardia seriolae NBRC 15557]
MEGAQALHRVGTGTFEGDVLTHDILDPDTFTNRRDIAVRNTACHGSESSPAQPTRAPPPLRASAPGREPFTAPYADRRSDGEPILDVPTSYPARNEISRPDPNDQPCNRTARI